MSIGAFNIIPPYLEKKNTQGDAGKNSEEWYCDTSTAILVTVVEVVLPGTKHLLINRFIAFTLQGKTVPLPLLNTYIKQI